ncbi:hypothetical protein AC623_11330 [Bacillus sp. FJAT-27231]|uniref:hypothetical protein n=1 Tax=Bacillus sp. FJAT-27231 TaxID=1679168 RepID=UPI000670EBDC|nr:hypothetical protein [Bacillus sp. FJAT-27231]KMY54429.1 hypothetical protein AC623_11330 [Bacillus sp. FJAT-27231]
MKQQKSMMVYLVTLLLFTLSFSLLALNQLLTNQSASDEVKQTTAVKPDPLNMKADKKQAAPTKEEAKEKPKANDHQEGTVAEWFKPSTKKDSTSNNDEAAAKKDRPQKDKPLIIPEPPTIEKPNSPSFNQKE